MARTFRGRLQPTIEIPPYIPAPEPPPVETRPAQPQSAVSAAGVWPLPSSPEIPHLVSMRANSGAPGTEDPQVLRRRWVPDAATEIVAEAARPPGFELPPPPDTPMSDGDPNQSPFSGFSTAKSWATAQSPEDD